jgi:transposase-like protein
MRLEVDTTKRKRRQFTAEFKADTVKLVRSGGWSIAQTARDLDLAETALRGWIRQAEIEAGEGPPGALNQACVRSWSDCDGRTSDCRWSATS